MGRMTRTEIILRQILRNYRTRLRFLAGKADNYSGNNAYPLDKRAISLAKVFANYLSYGDLATLPLRGARVLELGPGDTLTIGYLFAKAGASEVVCLDKFHYSYDTPKERQLCELLQLDPASFQDRVRALGGYSLEEATHLLKPESFDLIVSTAVLEEFANLDASFAAMYGLLRPGGRTLHKIDLSDYGAFAKRGFSPLEFLTVPDHVYHYMSSSAGVPNRKLANYYREKTRELGFRTEIWITNAYGAGVYDQPRPGLTAADCSPEQRRIVDQIRPRLLPRYRDLPIEDLVPSGIFLVAEK